MARLLAAVFLLALPAAAAGQRLGGDPISTSLPAEKALGALRPCPLPSILCTGGPGHHPSPPGYALNPGDAAPDYLQDPGRTAHSADDGIAPPLYKLWTRNFDAAISYPLIVGRRVFVVAASPNSDGAAQLFALSLRTGQVIWHNHHVDGNLTFDRGRILSVDNGGVIEAVSAASGRLLWKRQGPDTWYEDPPIAVGGTLYVVSYRYNYLSAINERTGATRWRIRTDAEYGSSLAVDSKRVYVDSCAQVAAYSRSTGALIWKRAAECSDLSYGATRFGNVLAANDKSRLVKASTGQKLGGFPHSYRPPAVAGNLLIVNPPATGSGTVAAVDPQTGRYRWKRSLPIAGPPLTVGRDLFVPAGSRILSFAAASGISRGGTPVPDNPTGYRTYNEEDVASAEGYLVVPYSAALTTYIGRYDPPSAGVTMGATPSVIVYGSKHRIRIDGRLGASFRRHGSTSIALGRAEWPEHRTHVIAKGRSFSDGGFRFYVRPTGRNTIYIVGPVHRRAKIWAAEVFVYPKLQFHFTYDRAIRWIKAIVKLRFDPGVHLNGHRGFLYLNRVGKRKLVRLGTGKIKGSHGRAFFRTMFRPLRRTGPKDTILWCTRKMTRLGLGYPDIVDARCGAATIRYSNA